MSSSTTYTYGEDPTANLDELVPNYYHRLDANGVIETGSCCYDTASEHLMMEKLMIDTVVLNAREYKIDGFRFDAMGLHFVYNMTDIRAAVARLVHGLDAGAGRATGVRLRSRKIRMAENGPVRVALEVTLIRTPGVSGGYPDQATQDIVHREFTYGLAGHTRGWREAQTDWQGQRLEAPLLALAASHHPGTLGKSFSLLKLSNPRVRVLALEKVEVGDELNLRLVGLDGKPQSDVHVSFAASITGAREVNGQEQPLRDAHLAAGELVTSFTASQPRTFALKLGTAPATVAQPRSAPVALNYDVATASNTGEATKGGIISKGDALPAEMLPSDLPFNNVTFHLARAKAGVPNGIIASGQKLALPAGQYNRVYLLAASADGDQKPSARPARAGPSSPSRTAAASSASGRPRLELPRHRPGQLRRHGRPPPRLHQARRPRLVQQPPPRRRGQKHRVRNQLGPAPRNMNDETGRLRWRARFRQLRELRLPHGFGRILRLQASHGLAKTAPPAHRHC